MRVNCAKMLQQFFKYFQRKLRTSTIVRSKVLLSIFSFLFGYFFHFIMFLPEVHKIDILYSDLSTRMQHQNPSDVLLVILIFSSVNNFKKRQTIRETWLSNVTRYKDVRHYFVISAGNIKEDQKMLIQIEQDHHKDLIIFSNLEDSFHLLTSKLVAAFGWLTDIKVLSDQGVSTTFKPFNNFKFVLKCDDDSYVRVTELVNELIIMYSNKKGENLYWGFFDGRAKAKKSGKYKEEEWKICDYYNPYALGGGYILAYPLVEFIAKNERFLKKYKNEDISVGAWLANYDGINRVHDPRFDTEYISRGCHQSYLITHKHSEFEMRKFYNNLMNTGHLCQKEFKTRMSYIYNWQVLPSNCCSRINPSVP